MKTQPSPPATRAVVTWAGRGEPVMLKLYNSDGEVAAVPLLPKRALTLAKELIEKGVSSIKEDWSK